MCILKHCSIYDLHKYNNALLYTHAIQLTYLNIHFMQAVLCLTCQLGDVYRNVWGPFLYSKSDPVSCPCP